MGDISGYTDDSVVTINGVNGDDVGTITTNADMTLGDLLTAMAGFGISGTIDDGVISLTSSVGNYATGDLMTTLGIGSAASSTTTVTIGQENTS